jgi:hypothetical protein
MDFKCFIRELKAGAPVDVLLDKYSFLSDWWYKI